MRDIEQMRALLTENSAGLLHPRTSEEEDATFDRILDAIEDVQSYLVVVSWFAAAGAGSLQVVRDRMLPPEAARMVMFSPEIGVQASGEPRTPTQAAAARIITAAANEDFQMALALAGPFVADPHAAGRLLSDIALLGRGMHQSICGGGH